jgi:hypothetical protein
VENAHGQARKPALLGARVHRLTVVSAAIEAFTGLVLIVIPSPFGQLVLGTDLAGTAQGVARLAGIALLALGVACWPGQGRTTYVVSAVRGLLVYNLLVAIYLCYWRFAYSVGPLLWPAVALHAILAALFVRALLSERTQ